MKLIIIILLSLTLGACSSSDMSDLKDYIKDVKARPPGGIQPIPEPQEVENFLYVADDRRDPFLSDGLGAVETETIVESGLSPNFDRRKEELESYSLDSLRMVGTLEQGGGNWALVKTSDGTIHRVQKDNYMGRNHGKITMIDEDKITLLELVKVGSGYQEQSAALTLGDSGK